MRPRVAAVLLAVLLLPAPALPASTGREARPDRALILAPASPSWGGSAVVDDRGRVIGIASLRLGARLT
jgi:hypothetical protein